MSRVDLDKFILNAHTSQFILQVCIMFFQKIREWLQVNRNSLLDHAKYSEKPKMHVNQYLTHYVPPLSLTNGITLYVTTH